MNRRRLFPALLSLLFITQSLIAASNKLPYKSFPPAWQATLDLMTAPLAGSTEGLVPGAVVVIKSPEFGVRVGTVGYADIASKKRMDPDLHFRVGSVTKSFTAQTILELEQEGKLKLTDPVTKYLGDDPIVMAIPNIQLVTIGEALQMNTGIANYLGNKRIAMSPQVTPDKHYTPNDLLAVLDGNYVPASDRLSPTFDPPTASYPNPYWKLLNPTAAEPPPFAWWDYSNSNYILLGMVIEKLTGKPIHDVMKHDIFDRLGLRDTYFATDELVPPDTIRGYTHWNADYSKRIYDTWHDITNINATYAWTAGAIISTPWDLVKYVDTIFKTNEILDPGTKEKWLTFVSADIHWPGMEYGAGGLMQAHRIYGDLRGHGGAYPGYKTLMYYFFDSDTTFVLCTNTMDQLSEYIAPEVMILDSIMPLVKSAVTAPKPANRGKAAVHDGSVRLAWQAGRVYGTSYDVYVGTDPDRVERATSTAHDGVELMITTTPSIRYKTPSADKAFYWRVDTISAGQPFQLTKETPISPFVAPIPPTVNGPVWSFHTTAGGRS